MAGFETSVIEQCEAFVLVLTTPKMTTLQHNSPVLQCDATYKLCKWFNFPVLLAGFSDASNVFYPTFVALSSSENASAYEQFFRVISRGDYAPRYIMADGDTAISTGEHFIR